MNLNNNILVNRLIKLAIEEDFLYGDVTTDLLIPDDKTGSAVLIAKENLVLCGQIIAQYIFNKYSPEIKCDWFFKDGENVLTDEIICRIKGPLKAIISGERVVLNFLQHLSAIATKTRKIVNQLHGTKIKLLDTRKTLPGWRLLEKYAVRIGGGKNHRFSLFDGILIKDNHIKCLQDIELAMRLAKKKAPHLLKIEVEVENIHQLKRVLPEKPDIILLDNFSLDEIQTAIKIINKNCKIEVSGNITEDNIKDYLKLDIDYISMGSLTHSVKAVDISLEIQEVSSDVISC